MEVETARIDHSHLSINENINLFLATTLFYVSNVSIGLEMGMMSFFWNSRLHLLWSTIIPHQLMYFI